ncbi:MAG: hypothetical protein M3Z36_10680 [Acidobacteriota bacterium]|nr:hypothetical protein [Acidobacteriota bacterium]
MLALFARPLLAQSECLPCHKLQVEAFAQTGMGRSVATAVNAMPPPATFRDTRSGALFSVEHRDGKVFHAVQRYGLTAEYPIAFAIGSGKVGYSFAVRVGDSLFESPISWFSQARRFDLSPGFGNDPNVDFDRRLTMGCLYCHTGQMRKVSDPPHSISCERCHATSGKHFANPVKLAPPARDIVCEQCHLLGESRVLRSGSSWNDADPSYTTYVASNVSADLKVVSQVEQLALSECARNSGGKLWCGTCHDPHGPQKDQRQVCLSCHEGKISATHAELTGCAGCHMPARPTPEVAHTVYTDHRIRIRPDGGVAANSAPGALRAWREPPQKERDRNLGLAYVDAGEQNRSASLVQKGFSILVDLKERDADVLSALGSVLLQKQRPAEAAAMFAGAVRLEPASALRVSNLGVALISAGDVQDGIAQLERVIELDPLLEQAYVFLADTYARTGQQELRKKVIERFLTAMPQNLKFHSEFRKMK